MPDFGNQVWVTSALNDQEVEQALVLCYSLRRTFTFRKIALIASFKISANLRKIVDHGFDFVFYLDEDRNTAGLKPEDFVKLYSLAALRAFDSCAYLSPKMMALKNCDEIFAQSTPGFRMLKNATDTSVFMFKPSIKCFDALMNALNIKNGTHIGTFMQRWATNLNSNTILDEKYNMVITPGKALLGLETAISIVNFAHYPSESSIQSSGGSMEESGLLGKLVAVHWLKIRREDVLPRLRNDLSLPCSTEVELVERYANKEPIAIVGMSCRYPSANNLQEFWELLFNGQDGTGTNPEFRWTKDQCCVSVENARNKTNAGFLKVPVDEFDGKFFGISPKEALMLDPQHRLIHELVWEALENACIDPNTLRGTLGSVFLGSWLQDYKEILHESGNSEFYRKYMGNSIGAAAARISFLLGMTGPSIATESGCSSAMVAVHLACRSLQLGETNLSLACGANLLLHPFDKNTMPMVLSPDGRCKVFSEDANGFARAEGVGVLVLKRLSDAFKDGDHIWGLIRGSAVSQEGVSKSMGTPTVHSESLAMTTALADAHVDPEEVTYIEAHGTGTAVGDPMEVAAIANAYKSSSRKEPLIIGSVKTNVGHTESCSGITGIMKVILSMKHEVIPAHLNFSKLNPAIDLNAVPAVIPLEKMEWKKVRGKPRLAGVSSFGITGTDAHVIVEEPPEIPIIKSLDVSSGMKQPLHILKLSTKTEEAMAALLEKYQTAIHESNDDMADIAYSANAGRADFQIRAAIIAKTKEEAATIIEKRKHLQEETSENVDKICFLFTGQGSQYEGMAKALYNTSPIFKMHFDFCNHSFKNMYNISITDVLWSDNPAKTAEISRTIYSQTSIFCVEYALLKLWESWGVKPDYVLGHSLGEFAAAVCAGILTVEDAIKLVAKRSILIDNLPRGKMLVIKADQQKVEQAMKKFAARNERKLLDYAAVNSSEQTVVAGDSDVVLEFSTFCKNNKIKCIVLEATHAFHSKHMDPMLDAYRSVTISTKKQTTQKCKYISAVKGAIMNGDAIDAEYWVQHTREKVDFINASKTAVAEGCRIFIEIGPQPVLSALLMMNSNIPLSCMPSLKRKEDEWNTILNSVAKLYLKGVEIDWNGFDQFFQRKKVHLPHYPFMGKKFWPDLMQSTGAVIHPLIGAVLPNASSTKLFQSGVNLRSHEYVKDHAIGQYAVMPGAGFLEMILAGGLATVDNALESLNRPTRPMKVENLMIQAPLLIDENKSIQLQTVTEFNKSSDKENDWNDLSIKIYHRVDTEISEKWLPHATATFSPLPSSDDLNVVFDRKNFLETAATPFDAESILQVYEKLASVGLKFGPAFQSLERIWKTGTNTAVMKVKIPSYGDNAQYIVHPVILDAMIQSIMVLKLSGNVRKKLYVPIKIGKFVWLSNSKSDSEERFIYVQDSVFSTSSHDESSTEHCSAYLLDADGTVLAVMSKVEYVATTSRAVESVLEHQVCSMVDLWEEVWRPQVGPMQLSHDPTVCQLEKFEPDEEFNRMTDELKSFSPLQQEVFVCLKKLAYYNILRFMYQSGFVPTLNDTLTESDLILKFKIGKEFSRLFSYYFSVLQEDGILEINGEGSWKVVKLPPTLPEIEAELDTAALNDDLMVHFRSTSLMRKLGENLHDILTNKTSPLPMLFPSEEQHKKWSSAGDFYVDYNTLLNTQPGIEKILRGLLSYCKSKHTSNKEKYVLRICEIGAGTGFFAEMLLGVLDECGIDFQYEYTDISAAFFTTAATRFEKYMKNISFKKLNIEEDPISQGFKPAFYDFVIASDVVHATKNLNETFGHINMLLKPRGSFLMVEQSRVSLIITYVFGVLEGFWRFEDVAVRPNHCTLSADGWVTELGKAGLEKIVLCLPVLDNSHAIICASKTVKQLPVVPEGSMEKTWLLFHQEDSATSNYLLKTIPMLTNRRIISIRSGSKFGVSKKQNDITINGSSEADFIELTNCVNNMEGICMEGVIYSWSLDNSKINQDEILKPFLFLSQSILRLKKNSGLKFVTLFNGVAPAEDNIMSHIHSSTIWGFFKSFQNEHSHIYCCALDIGSNETESGLMQTFYEIWNPAKAVMVAYHGNTRLSPRLCQHKPSFVDLKLPHGTDRFCLILPETRAIADLQFGTLDPLVLQNGEIEIQVKASALNFRDVLSVLKPSDDFNDSNSVGFDFAGVVKRLGPNVTKWSVGDNVFGINFARNALPSHIKLHQEDVLRIPENMTYGEASTLPAVVATSYHCLIDIAKVKAGETVLIHTASGGVGLSAIQICKHLGASIIATAGSKRKQNYLRSLGVQHIFHSRNTNYEKEILELTNGRGVDVVLNSLTQEGFKEATLNSCAKGARFVEMSKLNIWTAEDVKKLRPDVQYTTIDLTQMSGDELRRLMANVEKLAKQNVVQPIPYVRFDGVHVREALQYMQKARHIGKVVCFLPDIRLHDGRTEVYTPMFHENATYLIAGGLGGIGFEVCKWMVHKGARHVLLAGRNPPSSKTSQEMGRLNKTFAAKVTSVKLDISSYEQCRDLLEVKLGEMGYPGLRGVMNAAGTLSDGLIENQTWETFSSTLGTKVRGTVNLHELTKSNSQLEHFVLFSSIATLLGSPAQSNHSAGNFFEDTFAHYRNSIGLPATSINWGQWGEVGIATEIDWPGLKPFSTLQGLSGLEYALKAHQPQIGAFNITSFGMLANVNPNLASYLDERLLKSSGGDNGATSLALNSDEFWQQYDACENQDAKLELLKKILKLILHSILKMDETDVIHDNDNFQEIGIDSLMFVEIKNALQTLFGDKIPISASVLKDCNTVQLLAEALVKQIEGIEMDDARPSTEEVNSLIAKDCVLPEHIKAGPEQIRIDVTDISVVLLTGVTGTLGPYILRELCKYSQISRILCLIRPRKNQTCEQRLISILKEREIFDEVDMPKVRCVDGNMAMENLGMEPFLWEELCNSVDAVFHCAASVQHIEMYKERNSDRDMRAVNIGGTKRILEFACTGTKLKHIYLASSFLACSTIDENGCASETWPDGGEFNGLTKFAYPITKFVTEMLMKQAVVERGIPGKAFRFPFIVGDSKSGRFVWEQNHIMMRYLFILKNGCMPSNPLPVSFLPVDICASYSVKLFLMPDVPNDIYNLATPCMDADQEFVNVAKKLGYKVDLVDFSEFTAMVVAASTEDSPFAIFKEFYRNDEDILSAYNASPVFRQWVQDGGSNPDLFRSKKLVRYLPEFFTTIETSMEYLYRDFVFAKRQGWLDK